MVFEIWNDLSAPCPMMEDFPHTQISFDTALSKDVPLDNADWVFSASVLSPATDSLPEVIVTADRPPPPDFERFWSQHDYTAAFDYTNDWGPGGVDAGEVAAYATDGVSAAANEFADAHVRNAGTTVADAHAYKLVHDAFAKLYDWAKANSNKVIDVGNGHSVTANQILSDLGRVSFVIQTTRGNGANTAISYSDRTSESRLDPQNWNIVNAATHGDAGVNHVIFHELGHSINGFEWDVTWGASQDAATTTGNALAAAVGIANETSLP